MTPEDKLKVFEHELNWISNNSIRMFTEDCVKELPDYFFEVPASSTGKYHPEYSLGEGGLVRHTKAAVIFAKTLLGLEQNKPKEKYYTALVDSSLDSDIIISALILHDGLKHGTEGASSKYTTFNHPDLMADFIRKKLSKSNMKMTAAEINRISAVANCVHSHMGEWNTNKYSNVVLPKPISSNEKFVHMCDYLASRKYILMDFDKINI